MNYNTLMNKPTINYRELIGDNTVTEVGGITEEQFNTLLNTDLSSYYTKEQIDELFARSFIYKEKTGSIVTFDCPASITTGISEVTSEIVAMQSGTGDPSPTNVRPISGWSAVNVYDTGVNVWDEEWEVGAIGATTGQNYNASDRIRSKNYISAKVVEYYINTREVARIACYAENKDFLGVATTFTQYEDGYKFTPKDGSFFIRFEMSSQYGTTYNNDISINYPSTDTDYHAFSGTTYTTQLKDGQGNPLVCYGGELSNENGVQRLTENLKNADLSSLNWTKTDVEGNPCFYANLSDGKVASTFRGLCSTYKRTEDTTMSENGTIQFYGSERFGFSRVMIRDDNYASATASEFKSVVTGSIIYELATQQTIPQDSLSIASSAGINNIWCDSGDITVKALDRIIQG